MPRILVVDDDLKICRMFRAALEAHQFEVREALSGAELDAALERERIDLISLDLVLGAEDGIEIARGLIHRHDIPLIMVTGTRTSPTDSVRGLDLGADDYLTKPIDLDVYVARVRAVLRRYERQPVQGAAEHPERQPFFRFAGWTLDVARRVLVAADGQQRELSAGELALLLLFLDNPNRVLSRSEIKERLIGEDLSEGERAVDIRISRLRRKIEPATGGDELIRTVRGKGYYLDIGVEGRAGS